MEGSTRVRIDFEQKQPYLEVRVSKNSEDVRDEIINDFMQKGRYGEKKPWFTFVGNDEAKGLEFWRLDWIDAEVPEPIPLPEIVGQFPRRSQLQLLTPTERWIYDAMQEVEKLGAHPSLTNVVNLLSIARERLADWVENTSQQTEGPN